MGNRERVSEKFEWKKVFGELWLNNGEWREDKG